MMLRCGILHVIGVVGPAIMLATGCTADLKRRITILEDANTNLTEQLNQSNRELDAVESRHEELRRQLEQATAEADDLRAQLAEIPDTQPPAEGWTAVPGGAMIAIEGSVLFAPGQAVLRKESRRTLEAVVSTVNGAYADKDVLVFGHTDDRPISKSGWTDNWQLSTERALSVVRYMRERGVAPRRLVACGCGQHRPSVPNVSEADRAKNRRVEIFAVDMPATSGD
ncbi:MAG: OmpA family protein [Phycisphaerae bacterium]